MVEVKFCGVTRTADARQAAALGASYVGMVFAESPRKVSPALAREVAAVARDSGARTVGVFGEMSPGAVSEIAAQAGLDVVQLHADAHAEDVQRLRDIFAGEIWAAVRVDGAALPAHAAELFETADGVLLDARSPVRLGGTGARFDWEGVTGQVNAVRGRARLIVAGGLQAENVGAAIAALSPDVVDVSSGIESSPGVKDAGRMRAFVDAVRGSNLVRRR